MTSESQTFIKLESISAKILLCASLAALCISNSHLQYLYVALQHFKIFNNDLLFWINDGLMTLFFLVVGAEIKYELVQGSLNSLPKAILPGIAALGGMLVPAIIYAIITFHNPLMLTGWAIPTATDIAFALSVLLLVRHNVPQALKAFLTTLAILDDLAAIIIIAIFYTKELSFLYMAISTALLFFLFILNKLNVSKLAVYIFIGCLLWFCLMKSGIHPTLSGVILAFMIPLKKTNNDSPLQKIQHLLHPLVGLVILPLFAFTNAGVSFLNLTHENFSLRMMLAVLLALFFGKQIGIFSACWLSVKTGIAKLPSSVRWIQLYGVAILCGIGFTISLLIGVLAFSSLNESYLNSIKIGVILGSLLSGVIGYFLLRFSSSSHRI